MQICERPNKWRIKFFAGTVAEAKSHNEFKISKSDPSTLISWVVCYCTSISFNSYFTRVATYQLSLLRSVQVQQNMQHSWRTIAAAIEIDNTSCNINWIKQNQKFILPVYTTWPRESRESVFFILQMLTRPLSLPRERFRSFIKLTTSEPPGKSLVPFAVSFFTRSILRSHKTRSKRIVVEGRKKNW